MAREVWTGERISDPEKEPAKMSVAEFRASGLLLKINREVLHPLGLALETVVDLDTMEERFGEVWDSRDDPEGIIFDVLDDRDAQRLATLDKLLDERTLARQQRFGWVIQPVPSRFRG